MEFTTDQIVKIILAVIGLISVICGAIFAVNKRNHKIGNINGSNNNIINGDFTKNSNNKK
ncbi:hypothetical protein [Acinetobacter sp.]|uniref:hypothetical protein n=1 Tax=Acinetobacter sp. TaxID=472 RepID=UPI0033426241